MRHKNQAAVPFPLDRSWNPRRSGRPSAYGPESARHQKAVDAYFLQTHLFWKDVYELETLEGALYRRRNEMVLDMIDRLKLPSPSRVLEAGCGAGRLSVALAQRGHRVTAMDSVPAMLDLTARAALDAGVTDRIEVRHGDVRTLCPTPERFDLAVAVGVIPWVPHAEGVLERVAGALRSGGHLLLAVDNLWCLIHILDPRCFPALRPLRWRLAEALRGLGVKVQPRPLYYRHARSEILKILDRVELEKVDDVTMGFGPFTFFNRPVFPEETGIKIHGYLQELADRRVPGIRSLGKEYIVMAKKV